MSSPNAPSENGQQQIGTPDRKLALQVQLNEELMVEDEYNRRLAALNALYDSSGEPGLAVEAAEALNALVDKSTFVNDFEQYTAKDWEMFVNMCQAFKEAKRLEMEK